ncbi:aminopeptidase P family protein [Thaumasiovibrio subtropicus]|uniref:aminopeptidase P family protein n=1 Tax=Thaumasiovibrio subtropicus TaxID=1891207 RepID=UPI000B3590DC|nr:aminopeptidase P family protein [Thaumasiovibrio subtropicus]
MQATLTERVAALRDWLTQQNLDAIVIPHEDEFLGEYIPAHNERLLWATDFTGSAGAAVITRDNAAIFVDGRYTVQVRKQTPADLFEYRHLIDEPPMAWAAQTLAQGSKVAVDIRLHNGAWWDAQKAALEGKLELVAIDENPIDALWTDRPVPTLSNALLMPVESVGKSSFDKRQARGAELSQQGADVAVITSLDSIAWLLNVRGADIECLPVLLCHAVLFANGNVDFYIDAERLPAEFAAHAGEGVTVKSPANLKADLAALQGQKVLVDPATANAWTKITLVDAGATVIESADPCLLAKAAKNSTEIAGMKASHIRDGAAVSRFLAWFDRVLAAGERPNEHVLAEKLWSFRQEDSTLRDMSFHTISAAGGNAAMCHYRHSEENPGELVEDSLYLVDSGGQYLDGTTDITRTITVGNAGEEIKKTFTLVLKGHINLATARFPHGTTGSQLDALARQHLWAHGYDYDHGTGHGVGHFLNVHEGPARIAKPANPIALLPGMVLSNEPGYYRADAFGIRIENLELVVEVETAGDMSVLGFESLTRAPIDKRLIDPSLLTDAEIAWLNDYHQKVWNEISPLLDGEDKAWLEQATSPLV